MLILGIWLGSIASSYYIEYSSIFSVLKNVGDKGYKFIMENLKEKNEKLKKIDNVQTEKFIFFIPILNVEKAIQNAFLYQKEKGTIVETLRSLNLLEEMTDKEKEEYKKNPTLFNLLKIQANFEIKLSKAKQIILKDGEILYEIEDGEIIILKINADMSEKEAKEKVKEVLESAKEEKNKIINDETKVEEPTIKPKKLIKKR